MKIRNMTAEDWGAISKIYQDGMNTNLATFETKCPEYDKFDSSHIKSCRFIIAENENILGWCTLSPISSRCVYSGVAEVSIYIDKRCSSKGVGTMLLQHLIKESEEQGFWTLQSGIMEDNKASIRLHEKCGFRVVGYREKIGKDSQGNWRNTVLMERRSNL